MVKSKFYVSAARYGNSILLREMVDGVEHRQRVDYQPTLYRSVKSAEGELKSLFGEPVKSVVFDSIRAASDYVEEYKDLSNFQIYGQQNYVLQYLNEYNNTEPDFGVVPVHVVDIETEVPDSGFPEPAKAEARVVLITVYPRGKSPITFGLNPYAGNRTNYIQCNTEENLLKTYLDWWVENTPVILTGWNVDGFDVPYLAVRIQKILGDKQLNRLSPWGQVRIKESRVDSSKVDVEILGVSVLDYLALMKKYTYGDRASWKLGSVAADEVGHTKLDHSEHSSFMEFMQKDWNKFVDYNVIDTELVIRIDNKMKMIELAMTMAYLAKINFQDVYSPVKTWDAIIHNALLQKGIVVPQRRATGFKGEPIDGAYVKTPKPGMYRNVASVDATSLYPSIMQTMNLSPETYMGLTESTVDLCVAGVWPERSGDYAVGANGAMFSRVTRGILPELIDSFMKLRKQAKGEMLALKKEYELSKDETLTPRIAALDNKQMAAKILMNSLYGAIANNGFRFFNPDVAECITTTGQLYIKAIEKRLPSMIASIFKSKEMEYVVYADTDSIYLCLEEIIKQYVPADTEIGKVIKIMEKMVQDKIQPAIAVICDDVSTKMNVYDNKISFKLEIAADKAIFCAKKKYACRVYSSEGVTYAEPHLKVMGLEMVRSSTPAYIKTQLKEGFNSIFSTDESETQEYIQRVKTEFMGLPPEDIARISGVNNLNEYADHKTIYNRNKSVPIHVRAALMYNHLVTKHGLQAKYHLLKTGDKLKYVYLKVPNTLFENVIAWPVDEDLPPEFGLHKYVDYELQFEKTFLSAISIVLTAISWSPVKISTLDDFFS
jgi:DNA polymerase elongation subunit (family B)